MSLHVASRAKPPDLHPARRRATSAPLRPGDVAHAGGKLQGAHSRRHRESLVDPGMQGMNFLDQYLKIIEWQAGEMSMTDGSRVQITHEPAPATRPGIGCACITASPQEVPREETVEEVPENDSGELGACERVMVDRA
ncbi:conserved hypothetical protein, partial [Trichinella spiralis]|uniref:hypothetical protein n=1 Tax=Trichinella spiralis TaxID=6334 RepID=UPI0001EFD8DD